MPETLPGGAGRADDQREVDASARVDDPRSIARIRDSDMQPYVGLRYLSRLFKLMALVLVLMLFAEIVTGLSAEGGMPVPTLIVEISRWIVLAGLLWGAGDLATLMIDVGHDVRATRILLGRQAVHHMMEHHPEPLPPRSPRVPVADARSGGGEDESQPTV